MIGRYYIEAIRRSCVMEVIGRSCFCRGDESVMKFWSLFVERPCVAEMMVWWVGRSLFCRGDRLVYSIEVVCRSCAMEVMDLSCRRSVGRVLSNHAFDQVATCFAEVVGRYMCFSA